MNTHESKFRALYQFENKFKFIAVFWATCVFLVTFFVSISKPDSSAAALVIALLYLTTVAQYFFDYEVIKRLNERISELEDKLDKK